MSAGSGEDIPAEISAQLSQISSVSCSEALHLAAMRYYDRSL